MKNVFLSYQFGNEDRPLVEFVSRVIESHDLNVVRARRTGGEGVSEGVRARIRECDALVALLTRDHNAGDAGRPSDWVRDELVFAQNEGMHTIGLLEAGVQFGGMNAQDRERLPLLRDDPSEAVVALSETLHLWKKLRVKLQLLPDTVAETLGNNVDEAVARYRTARDGPYTEWRPANLVAEGYGTFAYVEPRSQDEFIQLEVKHNGSRWLAAAIQQWVRVELNRADGGSR